MNKILIFTTICVFLISCKKDLNKKDIFKVGETINQSIVEKDSTILTNIFNLSDSENAIKYKEVENIFSDKAKLLEADTIRLASFYRSLNMYYSVNEKYYNLEAIYDQDSAKQFYIKRLNIFDIEKQCEEFNNSPYNPNNGVSTRTTKAIDFQELNWTSNNNNQSFQSGDIKVQNNTKYDWDYVKFRLVLKNSFSEIFFNQTIESQVHLYKGDIVKINIPNLQNYNAGFDIISEKISFETELIEVKPKPKSPYCQKLEALKEKNKLK